MLSRHEFAGSIAVLTGRRGELLNVVRLLAMALALWALIIGAALTVVPAIWR